jgi:hypothetical protein
MNQWFGNVKNDFLGLKSMIENKKLIPLRALF